jgi:hypothetical protein
MRSSSRLTCAAAALGAVCAFASPAQAQQQAQGFAVERFYPSAPGGGWLVMDDLDMRGGLGGAMAVSTSFALKPLRVTDGTDHLDVISHQAFTAFGFAATYDRLRLYVDFTAPVDSSGQSGTVGSTQFTAPAVDPSLTPDTLSDARIGFDARILGDPGGAFRLGAGAQLYVPNGSRVDYDTDGTVRAMLRALVAGDRGLFTYAAQLGVHVRPLDDAASAGPRGSELLFGAAAGARFPVGPRGTVMVVGPEVYGETAFEAFFRTTTTALEGLLSARVEGTADDGPQLRVKLGGGGGLDQHFGAPEWRVVVALEVFDHSTDRDRDTITDSNDACPDVPGVRTKDPTTNGCPRVEPVVPLPVPP